MRTSQATINLVLNTQRKNKDGLCPVVLRVFWKGRKDRQTGIYVAKSQWSVKEQRVKPTHPESVTLNQRLLELKDKVIQRRNALVTKGLDYTIDDLLSERELLSSVSPLSSILESMVKDKGLSQNTAQAYRASLRRLSSVGVESVQDVSEDAVQGICKRLKGIGFGDSTVNVTLSALGSLWAYCQTKGLVGEGYLFQKFRFWKKYRIKERREILSEGEIRKLIDDFVNRAVIADGLEGVWCYRDGVEAELMNRNSELFAHCCFLLSYFCQGMAFCDLVRIKRENVSVVSCKGAASKDVEREGDVYYVISGLKRKKTNALIEDIYVLQDEDSMPLFEAFVRTMDLRQGYLLPVLQNNSLGYCYDSEKKVSEATGTCSVQVNRKLKDVLKRLGMDWENITLYAARHSYATHYMQNGGNPIFLADMMGRSVNGIFRYVNGLSSMEQNIRERSRVFRK